MRKSLIARSVATLIAGLGTAAVANAAVLDVPPSAGSDGAATQLVVNTDNVGHINLVPYYSTTGGNDTYINITNTDVVNGKAVKVRFRGAANSDDVYDITVLMSPGDIWAAAITKDAASGLPKLTHNDVTCTLPFGVKNNFVTTRLDPDLSAAEKAAQASEGYVEILNMADIPPTTPGGSGANALYAAIKHVDGKAPCNTTALGLAALNKLFTDSTDAANAQSKGLSAPTTGLMTNWTIINVPKAASYSGRGVAVEARDAGGLAGYGNMVLFPQAATPVPVGDVDKYTSDPLLRVTFTSAGSSAPLIAAAMFDFPDLSTPYLPGNNCPLCQASDLTGSLAVTTTTNEFVTDPGILGKTNWVFSMPTRRYNVAYDYSGGDIVYTDLTQATPAGTNYFTDANVTETDGQICVKGISTVTAGTVAPDDRFTSAYTGDREERSATTPSEFVISPGEPAAPLTFCGEVSVIGFNGTNPLGAVITQKDITGSFVDGWMRIAHPGLGGVGLPIIGNMMTELFNGAATAGTAGAYGQTFPHRHTRPAP